MSHAMMETRSCHDTTAAPRPICLYTTTYAVAYCDRDDCLFDFLDNEGQRVGQCVASAILFYSKNAAKTMSKRYPGTKVYALDIQAIEVA